LSKFFLPTDAQVNVLKTILEFTLKFTLKQFRHISVQSHHHQGALCLLAKVTVVKIAKYIGSEVD
jgi:hypothetical protein